MIDHSMLQEFITEAGEHLDEMETDLLQLEVEPENKHILNDIFREIHSVKGAAEYVGLEKMSELSHKLESLLEILRRGEKTVDGATIDLLIEARDRMALLTRDLESDKVEKSEIGDVVGRIEELYGDQEGERSPKADASDGEERSLEELGGAGDATGIEREDRLNRNDGGSSSDDPAEIDDDENYDEEYDKELFDIFVQQLQDNVSSIADLAGELDGAGDPVSMLDEILFKIGALRSSANYMGYEKLVGIYTDWEEKIKKVRERESRGVDADFGFMSLYLEKILVRFPRVRQVVKKDEGVGPKVPETRDGGETALGDDGDLDFMEAVEKELNLLNPSDGEEAEHADGGRVAGDGPDSGDDGAAPESFLFDDAGGDNGFLPDIFDEEEAQGGGTSGAAGGSPGTGGTEGRVDEYGFEKLFPLSSGEPEVEEVDLKGLEFLIDDRKLYDKLDGAFDAALQGMEEPLKMTPAGRELFSPARPGEDDFHFSESWAPRQADPVPPDEKAAPDSESGEEIVADALFMEDDPVSEDRAESRDEKTLSGENGHEIVPGELIERRRMDVFHDRVVKQTLRVDSRKIDDLMNQVGELVVSRAWFSQLFNEMREFQQHLKETMRLDKKEMKQVRGLTFRLSEATVNLGRVANELQEGIMKVRMLPISHLFNRYPRLVRDLLKDVDKKVRLEIKGEDTELDKMIIEEISDPLVHIIRNAVDHGIETTGRRRLSGKPETGSVVLEAYHESNHVVIEIKDDGGGIDPEKIKEKALEKGFATREELERMTRKEILSMIMKPGFSTRGKATHTSGRGVGMDVVRKNVEKLNGSIEIDSTVGKRAQFRIKIPLTLAIIPALLVRVGKELFTIPLANVEETLRIFLNDTTNIEGVEVIRLRDSTLPLVRLSDVFGRKSENRDSSKVFVVVVSTGVRRVGLVVDELIGQEEVVIKPLVDYLQERSGFSGATILGDGRISLILDVYELVNLTIDRRCARLAAISRGAGRQCPDGQTRTESRG